LVAKDAVIDIRYDKAIDSAGELHHKVAFYRFLGWEVATENE